MSIRYLVCCFWFICFLTKAQGNSGIYLEQYGISKDSINDLSFKDKDHFQGFIQAFEEKEGFQVPKFLIIDDTGKLLKHKLDILISECGKGDVERLKKKYYKKLPDLYGINTYFKEELQTPESDNFIVIFIWHELMDEYNRHTFETYQAWKEDENISFYFLELDFKD